MGQCVGIDVSKQHLDWVRGEQGSVQRVPNSAAGVRRLVAKLHKTEFDLVVVESTGATSER
jgi:transposase